LAEDRKKYSIPGAASYLDKTVPRDFSYSGSDASSNEIDLNRPSTTKLIK
jgi:hypothetical protein